MFSEPEQEVTVTLRGAGRPQHRRDIDGGVGQRAQVVALRMR